MNQIYDISSYNTMADDNWNEYVIKCTSNGLEPQKRSNFNQFMKFPYKTGFVVAGNYPLYYRTKKQALETLGLA